MKPFLALLLPLVLVGCGPSEQDAIASEQDAIDRIEKLGGSVKIDAKSGKVVEVWLVAPQFTDAGLVHLKSLTSLTVLSLHCPQITDAGLYHLKELTSLTVLGLLETQITDAGLAEIKAALPNCEIQFLR